MSARDPSQTLWHFLNDEEDARVCRDIPDEACDVQPQSFALQLVAQTLSKLADTLSSSRVVLPWLLGAIGAPSALVAWLVPLRESLSLLPQLVVAAQLRRQPLRRGFYVAGSLAQGLCLLAMPATLLLDSPTLSGVALLVLLGVFSLSRGVCSVASKDVLGKTVAKSRRGRLTGLAGSISGVFTIVLAAALLAAGGTAALSDAVPVLVAMLVAAGLCWFVVAVVYRQIPEQPGATDGGGNALQTALSSFAALRGDRAFWHFVLTRALLIAAAYAIPYLVLAAQNEGGGAATALAAILLAEGLAAMSSSTIWGYWSDSAAHRVMAAAAALTALALGVALIVLVQAPAVFATPLVSGAFIYAASVAHQGARVGRKTYLVDLATADNRASYVAVSNTVIGGFMLLGGSLGALSAAFGVSAVLAALLAMAVLATIAALRLPNVSND
uniref:Permease of the major facilitator superfamily n=1 Tax=Haliea sp. ETY-M TaxID=1055105 RepID=A0A455R1T9_9GAMM|nr:permease of the major facilitator superfamily [Haliea sp. ETY-M]